MSYNEQGIGYQKSETSKEAANFNKKGKLTIREQVRNLFEKNNMLTVEDVSRLLNRAEISIKPRVTELKNEGFLQDSGVRRQGKWGTNITVWKRAEKQMDLNFD